ncbi:MAG: DNA repair protein RecO [Pyrinomonadaceae bacterium]
MKVIESEAIILKNFSLAEADKIILCLTREAGLVRLGVRGAKRLKSRFCGRLEPFTIAEVIYGQKEETELGRLFQAEVLVSYFHLASRLNVLNALSYLSEILIAVTPPHEPNEVLYRMVRACLSAVDEVHEDLTAVRLTVAYFELWLLRLAGFLPDFQVCTACRLKIQNVPAYYSAHEARLICLNCAGENRRDDLMSARLLKVLRAAVLAPPLKFVETAIKLDVNQASLDNVTHRLLRKILEYDPQYWSKDFELEENPFLKIEQVA